MVFESGGRFGWGAKKKEVSDGIKLASIELEGHLLKDLPSLMNPEKYENLDDLMEVYTDVQRRYIEFSHAMLEAENMKLPTYSELGGMTDREISELIIQIESLRSQNASSLAGRFSTYVEFSNQEREVREDIKMNSQEFKRAA